jgi:hypothetical protein
LEVEFNFETVAVTRSNRGEEELEMRGWQGMSLLNPQKGLKTVRLEKPFKGIPSSHWIPSFQFEAGTCETQNLRQGVHFWRAWRSIIYIAIEPSIWLSCWPEWPSEKWKNPIAREY